MSRADKFTIESKKKEFYSDFLANFDKNPVTGFLAKVTNERSVEQSVRNIILTNNGEWPFEYNLGSKLRASLFEPADPRTYSEMQNSIQTALKNNEPRVDVHQVQIAFNVNDNSATATIVYSIINIADQVFSLDVTVNRVR